MAKTEHAAYQAGKGPGLESALNPQDIPLKPSWHAASSAMAVEAFRTTLDGLTGKEAARRLAAFGPNRLPPAARRSALVRFLMQFHNPLIYVLLASALLSGASGHPTDSLVILGVVLANALIGFIQEGRAERALDAINAMIDPHASAFRDGQRITIAADEVVPGDMILLEAGDRVPADVRLVKARNLRVDEALLTGESVPADKAVHPVAFGAGLADRVCMAYSGAVVTAGQGIGVVVATGAETELGRISTLIGTVTSLTTPLVRQMDLFARQVTLAVLAVSVLVFGYSLFVQSYGTGDAFMVVVGLAVAAIPEGLPAVMTITLAVGVRRMARRHAIIRRLPAVETLGSVSLHHLHGQDRHPHPQRDDGDGSGDGGRGAGGDRQRLCAGGGVAPGGRERGRSRRRSGAGRPRPRGLAVQRFPAAERRGRLEHRRRSHGGGAGVPRPQGRMR